MRFRRGYFIVTGPDIEPLKFESRREARDWCAEPHPGSPIGGGYEVFGVRRRDAPDQRSQRGNNTLRN
jgi:hypothetical protein